MLSWNVIQTRDIIRPKDTNIKGVILKNGLIMDKGEEKSLNQFVKDALEWSSIKPYTLAIHEKTGKSLSQIRLEYMKNNNMI